MKFIYCVFVFIIPLLVVPSYARVLLSVRPRDELAAFITIYDNYGRKTLSPPPSPSGSPSPHHAVHGATTNSNLKMSRNTDLTAPLTTHGQSDQRISRNTTAYPPPSAKPSPTPIPRTRAPPPPPKTSPTQKNRAPPPPPKGSITPTQGTRAPPPPPPQKPSPSDEHLGISSSTASY